MIPINFIPGTEVKKLSKEKDKYLILGIDVGSKKIGLATFISEIQACIPHKTIKNDANGMQYILNFVKNPLSLCTVVGVKSQNSIYEEEHILHEKANCSELPKITNAFIENLVHKIAKEKKDESEEYKNFALNSWSTLAEASNLYELTNNTTPTKISLTFFDEHMTTVLANQRLKEIGLSRDKRYKTDDKIAASILLEKFVSFFLIS